MKIFVTGSRGMLGTDLVNLLQEQYEVLGCDIHNCDILKYEQLEAVLSSYKPDVIIHTAAYTNVDKAESTAGKVIKTTKDGIDIARELAGHYNQIAQWCGLPRVPKPFTKK